MSNAAPDPAQAIGRFGLVRRNRRLSIRIALICWGLATLAVILRVAIQPLDKSSVFDVYTKAARHWLAGAPVYDWQEAAGYRYAPTIAILFVPSLALPDRVIRGTLTITAGSASKSQFTIEVDSLTAADSAGEVPNFDPNHSYSYEIATTDGINGFDSADLAVDTTGFANPTDGTFSVSAVGNDVFLNYTPVPEPAMIGAALPLAALLRRRRQLQPC